MGTGVYLVASECQPIKVRAKNDHSLARCGEKRVKEREEEGGGIKKSLFLVPTSATLWGELLHVPCRNGVAPGE